jgi:hypothetical protein
MPYQATDVDYQFKSMSGPSASDSYWIAIYNNAPYTGGTSATGVSPNIT